MPVTDDQLLKYDELLSGPEDELDAWLAEQPNADDIVLEWVAAMLVG